MTMNRMTTIRCTLDLVTARKLARDMAGTLGFRPIDQVRIITAVNELASNIFRFAGTGTVTLREIARDGQTGIEVICQDRGPGIADLAYLLEDQGTPKRGLVEARRLMDTFEIETELGGGTTVICRKWRA
jgi:serine/threonine-protein kinase RsbT